MVAVSIYSRSHFLLITVSFFSLVHLYTHSTQLVNCDVIPVHDLGDDLWVDWLKKQQLTEEKLIDYLDRFKNFPREYGHLQATKEVNEIIYQDLGLSFSEDTYPYLHLYYPRQSESFAKDRNENLPIGLIDDKYFNLCTEWKMFGFSPCSNPLKASLRLNRFNLTKEMLRKKNEFRTLANLWSCCAASNDYFLALRDLILPSLQEDTLKDDCIKLISKKATHPNLYKIIKFAAIEYKNDYLLNNDIILEANLLPALFTFLYNPTGVYKKVTHKNDREMGEGIIMGGIMANQESLISLIHTLCPRITDAAMRKQEIDKVIKILDAFSNHYPAMCQWNQFPDKIKTELDKIR